MSRRILVSLLLVATTSFAVAPARAEEGKGGADGLTGGIYLFSRDVPLPTSPTLKQGIVGLGYEMTGKLGSSPHWGWNGSFGYGIGSWIEETTPSGGPTDKTELNLSHWEARLGFDYWDDCCDQDWFCGPALIYSSSKLKAKSTGSPDFDYEPVKTIGLDSRAGGQFHLGTNARMFGAMDMITGYSSFKQTETGTEVKIHGWSTSLGWRGGVRFHF